MHADGKSTLASASKWNSVKVNWLHFYLSEPRVLAKACRLQKLFCIDTGFTEQAFSHVERRAYEVFIVEI